jgi:GR25 family glycosyltransferase involved in LPS biosynthesis
MTNSYIIHLPTSTARQPLVAALVTQLPGAQVVDAVDGRLMSAKQTRANYQPHSHYPRYPFTLLPGEVGCFLSHRKCWQMIVDSGDDYALIVEDDVALNLDILGPALALALTHMTPTRFIRLPLSNRETPAQMIAQAQDITLFRPAIVGLGTAFQIVGRDIAARLLELTAPFDRPVDTFLQMTWLTGADVATAWPNGVASAAAIQGGSTIQAGKPLLQKLPREWRRWRYRRQIRNLSERHLALPDQTGHHTGANPDKGLS